MAQKMYFNLNKCAYMRIIKLYICQTRYHCICVSSERGSRALHIYKRETEWEKKGTENSIELFVALFQFQINTILIISSHPFSFDRFFLSPFGWFSIWFSFVRFFARSFVWFHLLIHSFVYSLIRHMCATIVFPLCTILMHHSHIFNFFSISFSISVFLSHFRHANSRWDFFHSFIECSMFIIFEFQKKKKTKSNQREIIFHIFTIENNIIIQWKYVFQKKKKFNQKNK